MILFLSFIVSILTFGYYYFIRAYDYWNRKGIHTIKPTFPTGNFWDILRFKLSLADMGIELYKASDKPYSGIFAFVHPILVIRDAKLMQQVSVQDFSHFYNRGLYSDADIDLLTSNLVTIEDQKWKILRTKLTPAFTPGKLKSMFQIFVDCGLKLNKRLNELAESHEVVEVGQLAASHTINITASAIFGLEVDCVNNPESDFRAHGRKVPQDSLLSGFRTLVCLMSPQAAKFFKVRLFDKEVEDFFVRIMTENMEYREKNNIVRKDFFQLLIQLKNGIDITDDDRWTNSKNVDENERLSLNEIVAEAFLFYMAGYETSSISITWCIYELSRNPDAQKRVQEEIDDVLKRHNGQYSYEALGEMKYLEMCVDETLRMYPPLPILSRKTSKAYTLPNTNIVLEKGTDCLLPIVGVHRDPKYYPNPDDFQPERFSDVNRNDAEFEKKPYLPFGAGPRNCIGIKFAKTMMKISLAMMLEKYCYELSDKLDAKYKANEPEALFMVPKDGVKVQLQRRQ